MADIRQAFEYAAKNPNSDFAKNLGQLAKSGALDVEAKNNGIDLTPFKPAPEPKKSVNNATFQATGDESIVSGAAKAVGNIPSSGITLGKNVLSAVVNPVQTVKAVRDVVAGAGAKIGETILEDTDFGQKLLQKANDVRVSKGLAPLQKNEKGQLQGVETKELQVLNNLGGFLKERYGSEENLKKTLIEDPVGALADIASVVTAGGGALRQAGNVSKVSALSEAGGTLSKVGQALEPINAISNVAGKTARTIKNTTAGRIASEVLPTSTDMKQGQIVKALDLTQGDLVNINKKTGNDVTKFITSNNLIKDTPEQIVDGLNSFRKNAKEQKALVIGEIKNVYTPEQVPSVIKGLDSILEDIKDVPGLEGDVEKITKLRTKKQFTLEDIQDAQYLLDENTNIYSKFGDAKSTTKAKGLDNIRKDIRSFIENEVDIASDGNVDIRKVNNDIQTSYAIEDAINTRATRGQTRAKLSLSDNVVLFGGGAAFDPFVGVGLYVGKKIIETPSFRIAFVKALEAKPVAKVRKMVTEIKNKTVSPETQAFIKDVAKEVTKNKATIESGSAILNKSKEEKQK